MKTFMKVMAVLAIVAGISFGVWYAVKDLEAFAKGLSYSESPQIDISQVKNEIDFYEKKFFEIRKLRPAEVIEVTLHVSLRDLEEQKKCREEYWPKDIRCKERIDKVLRQIEEKYKSQYEIDTYCSSYGVYDTYWFTKAIMMFYPKQRKH